MFTSYAAVRALGELFNWKHGEWVAVLSIPDSAPLTFEGPDRTGHVMLYDADGRMIEEELADRVAGYVVRLVHGPTVQSFVL
jgi:YD repeat-containing protein